jgi:hypothetical protein
MRPWNWTTLLWLTLPLSGRPGLLNESRGLVVACPLEGHVRCSKKYPGIPMDCQGRYFW